MSLKPLVEPLSKALGKPVAFVEDCIGPLAEDAVRVLKPGDVLLLENLRFHKEEEKNDPAFIDKLSVLGDVYVNDAFSAAHRAHASTEGLANRLPAAAGRLMQAELEALDKALGNPKRPVCAVVGGAKVSSKLDLLGNLVGRVDKLIIGGGMANTFLHAQGMKVGKSLCEKDLAPTALEVSISRPSSMAPCVFRAPAPLRRLSYGRPRSLWMSTVEYSSTAFTALGVSGGRPGFAARFASSISAIEPVVTAVAMLVPLSRM